MQRKPLILKNIKLEQMSKETNISQDEIRKAFDGTTANNGKTQRKNSVFKLPFVDTKNEQSNERQRQQELEQEELERKEKFKQILEGTDYTACELYDYMDNLSEIEKIPFYEKLRLLITTELQNTDDLDDLVKLWKHSPYDSPEEKQVRDKIKNVLTTYLAGETDIDMLTEKFEELPEALDAIEGRQILRRAIELCSTDEECDTVSEHLPRTGSSEDKLLNLKRNQIETEAIQRETDIDELKDLYNNAESASENERRAAEKLVELYTSFEDLREDLVDFFEKGTYGHFLTIKKMIALATTLEEADQVIDECGNSTEELYRANEAFDGILLNGLVDADVNRLDEIFEFISSNSPYYDEVMEKKAAILTDIDELEEFLEDCTEESVAHDMVSEKIFNHYKQLIERSNDFDATLDLIENTLQDDGPLHDLAMIKLQSKAVSEEEHEIVISQAISSSYIEYLSSKALLALRGGPKQEKAVVTQTITQPVIDETTQKEKEQLEKEEKEYQRKCDEAQREINRSFTPAQARSAYDLCPDGSEEQISALSKIDTLVKSDLARNPSAYTLGQLYTVTLPDTETRFEVIKKMAESYQKSWWQF